jgi:hypothetical protein
MGLSVMDKNNYIKIRFPSRRKVTVFNQDFVRVFLMVTIPTVIPINELIIGSKLKISEF